MHDLTARTRPVNLFPSPRAAAPRKPQISPSASNEKQRDPSRSGLLHPIIVNNRPLRDVTADAIRAVEAANNLPLIFQRGAELVRVRCDESERPLIEPLSESALRGLLERAATWLRLGREGTPHHVSPTIDVVRDIASLGRWPFPRLSGITESPVLRPDGTVLNRPGYDLETGLFYALRQDFSTPTISNEPTNEEVARAIGIINEMIADFPFDSAASRANAIGFFLTPILRPMISGAVPLALIDKPSPGTGASLLAEAVSMVATNRRAEFLSPPKDDDEVRKMVTSILLSGISLAVFDNADRTIGASSLARMLTASTWKDRLLGRNITISVPQRTVWIVTGNNLQIGGDLGRRSYLIRLDARVPRPWERANFRHPDLLAWIDAHRGELLWALLTLARAWVAAGSPGTEVPVIGGFEAWVRIVGGVLGHAGIEGFLGNREQVYQELDDAHAGWETFLRRWRDEIDHPITVAELVKRIESSLEFRAVIPDSLADAFTAEHPNTRRIGVALRQLVGIRFAADGLRVERGLNDTHNGQRRWQVLVDPAIPPINEIVDRPTQDDGRRAWVLAMGASLDWQALPIGHGESIAHGESSWQTFYRKASEDQISRAIGALHALDAQDVPRP